MSRSGRRHAPPAHIDLSQQHDEEDAMPLSSLASLARSVKREEYKDSPHTQPNATSPPRLRSRLATQAQRDRQRTGRRQQDNDEEEVEEEQAQDDEEQEEEEKEEEKDDDDEHEYDEKQQPPSPSHSLPPLSPTQPPVASSSSSNSPPPYSSYFTTVSYHQLATTLSNRQQHNTQLARTLQQSTQLLASLHTALPPQLANQLRDDYRAAVSREHVVGRGMKHGLEVARRLMEAGEVGWETRWEEEMGSARAEGEEKGRDELRIKLAEAEKELAERKLRQQRERDRQQQRLRDRQQGRHGEADGEEEGAGEEGKEMADGGDEEEQPGARDIILPLSQNQSVFEQPSASGRARMKRERR